MYKLHRTTLRISKRQRPDMEAIKLGLIILGVLSVMFAVAFAMGAVIKQADVDAREEK